MCVVGTCVVFTFPLSDSIAITVALITYRNILRCAASKYNCTNRNPCSPTLCEAGVFNYPGTKAKKYVHCNGSGGCAVLKCPRRQIWNQGTQSCQPKVNQTCICLAKFIKGIDENASIDTYC